jgi:hypothetical protein
VQEGLVPRRSKVAAPPVIPTTALVASSTRYPGKAARIYQPRQDWQRECYRHYAICGEARFAAQFFGHACSKAVLGVAEPVQGTDRNLTSGPAFETLNALFAGKDGQEQMLSSIGTHLTIAGECYLVGRKTDQGDVWEIVSCIEMVVAGNQWQIQYGDGMPAVTLTDEDVVIRIWLPSPARRIEADSPFRALLPILGEIEWLTRHVFAQITSRLASAGILLMPQGMSFPPPPNQGETAGQTTNEADTFMATLGDAMLTPIQDPGSPSAVVPIVVTAPGEELDKPRLLTFWSDLDAEAKELRNEAIRRFALGMDLPPEQILGMSAGGTGGGTTNGVSHWGAWQIEESTIKLHIEPMLDTIVNALTMGYLRPAMDSITASRVTYDSSRLRLRPDRSKEAAELYDRGVLSVEALLRENGFDKDDLPPADEFRDWLLRKIASGSATPEQVGEAARQLGVDLGPLESTQVSDTREARPAPSLEDHPRNDLPPASNDGAVLAACDALVYRALERAGNKLRQRGLKPPCPAYETHLHVKANGTAERVLDDAWSCAAQVLDGLADPEQIIPLLNTYALTLLNEQSAHSRERLGQWLELGGAR